MRIAVFGDVHGHWQAFRDAILSLHEVKPLDLVLQVGDAEPIRDETDLAFVNAPARYRTQGDFAISGEDWLVPTCFIGGNHEPWNVLESMPSGGELRPNLHYLGRVGFLELGPLRIAGLTGIFSPRNFDRPRPRWPFRPDQSRLASYYHREDLNHLSTFEQVDILLLHEWPPQMEAARTPHWPTCWSTIGNGHLGEAVSRLRPRYVFCGHMHVPAHCVQDSTQFVALGPIPSSFSGMDPIERFSFVLEAG